MGRAPCCEKVGLNRGPWTREEDLRLIQYIESHREGSWRTLPKAAGLLRCGKSCRLRWINYLRPDLKRGNITEEEDRIIIKFHATLGNRWSLIAANLPGRTDNEIKNYWNTYLKKKLRNMGLDPQTHQPLQAAASSSTSLREMIKVDAGSMKGRNANSTEEFYCRPMDPQTHQPLQAASTSSTSLREMIKVDAGSMKGRNANSTEEFYCRPMDPQTHQPLQASSTSSTSLREMIKVDAGSMKGRNANSTEEFYCREKLFSSPYFSDDLTVTPSNSRSNYSLIASHSSSFDIRSRDLNISQVMQELAPGSQANSINNLLTMWSDTVNNGPAPIYSTTCQAVHYNSITTNSEDLINVDNNPSALDLHLFPNVPSSNALLSLIDNEILSGSQIINMDGQHRSVEEELDAAAAGLPNAFHESTSSDLWNL